MWFFIREFPRLYRQMWHAKADNIRNDWAGYVTWWEEATKPGYPLSTVARQRRELALAIADAYDALGGKR